MSEDITEDEMLQISDREGWSRHIFSGMTTGTKWNGKQNGGVKSDGESTGSGKNLKATQNPAEAKSTENIGNGSSSSSHGTHDASEEGDGRLPGTRISSTPLSNLSAALKEEPSDFCESSTELKPRISEEHSPADMITDTESATSGAEATTQSPPISTNSSHSVFGLYERLDRVMDSLEKGTMDPKVGQAICQAAGRQLEIVNLLFEAERLRRKGNLVQSIPMLEEEPRNRARVISDS